MKVVYARQKYRLPRNAIFLVGPTPRDKSVETWRPEALEELKKLKYRGTVFVPEDAGWESMDKIEYDDQIGWERKGLRDSTVVAIWCPRVLENMAMPALTTNIEFGAITGLGRAPLKPYVVGYPKGTRKMGYFDYVANEQAMPIRHTLQDTLAEAVRMARQPR